MRALIAVLSAVFIAQVAWSFFQDARELEPQTDFIQALKAEKDASPKSLAFGLKTTLKASAPIAHAPAIELCSEAEVLNSEGSAVLERVGTTSEAQLYRQLLLCRLQTFPGCDCLGLQSRVVAFLGSHPTQAVSDLKSTLARFSGPEFSTFRMYLVELAEQIAGIDAELFSVSHDLLRGIGPEDSMLYPAYFAYMRLARKQEDPVNQRVLEATVETLVAHPDPRTRGVLIAFFLRQVPTMQDELRKALEKEQIDIETYQNR